MIEKLLVGLGLTAIGFSVLVVLYYAVIIVACSLHKRWTCKNYNNRYHKCVLNWQPCNSAKLAITCKQFVFDNKKYSR